MSIDILGTLRELYLTSGIAMYASDPKALIMVAVACLLLYLAIVKKFEPLLLLPIAFGMLLTNLLGSDIYHEELFAGGHVNWGLFGGATLVNSANLADLSNLTINAAGAILTPSGSILGNITATLSEAVRLTETGAIVSQATGEVIYDSINVVLNSGCYLQNGQVFNALGELVATSGKTISAGLLDYLYLGVKLGIYPCLIFMGVGAGTDFGPLIANPKTLLLGAAAQLGIFLTFMGAILLGFTSAEASAIGIIGGADGPTAIWLTGKLAPHLLGPIAVAAYSYMALVPVIQPPIMKALTTKKERSIVMEQLRPVSKLEKILFPIIVTVVVCLILPTTAPLVGMLMLGNLFRESGVVNQLTETASNALMYIVVIMLGTSVGATTSAEAFLKMDTIKIVILGLVAFAFGTAGGVLLGKLMCKLSGGKINPLIGSAGVSAVPMAARVSQKVGSEADPTNFLLMHALGPNVAGVIGTAVAAGTFMAIFGVK